MVVAALPVVNVVGLMELAIANLHFSPVHNQALLGQCGVQVHGVHHIAHLQVTNAARRVGQRVAPDAYAANRHGRKTVHCLQHGILSGKYVQAANQYHVRRVWAYLVAALAALLALGARGRALEASLAPLEIVSATLKEKWKNMRGFCFELYMRKCIY